MPAPAPSRTSSPVPARLAVQPPQAKPPSSAVTSGYFSSRASRVSATYVGRRRGGARRSSAGRETPVRTSRLSAPARWAASMSVSSRSPTTSGFLALVRMTDSRCRGGSGLPAISGVVPVACAMTWSSEPLPGWVPRGPGRVLSALVPTKRAPARTARPPSARLPYPMPGPHPWTTASGLSAAVETGLRPRSLTASLSAVLPITRTFACAGSLFASRHVHGGQQGRDGGGGAGGVVGDVAEAHAALLGFPQRLRGAGDRRTADVDDAVQVEQGDIVGGAEPG